MDVHMSGEQAGTCTVIWDSDQCHTRPLHSRLGNKHAARIGTQGEYHLVLAEDVSGGVCDELAVVHHRIIEGGIARTHLEVIRACTVPSREGPSSP